MVRKGKDKQPTAAAGPLPLLPERFLEVKKEVERWWPRQWPIHAACLSTAATLLLENVGQCVALILIGASGVGKGSILYGYGLAQDTIFRSKFTAASILSSYGDAKRQDLESRALFRLVKHRLFVCSDLNPLLKTGDRDRLSRFYADLAVWLDGEGVVYDSGTHGPMGERGDFTFAMVGAATPFRPTVWRSMAELGPRLLFVRLNPSNDPDADLPARVYDQARDACGEAVREFLNWLFTVFPRRSQPWRECTPDQERRLKRLCRLSALSQSYGGGNLALLRGEEPVRPTPSHLFQRLSTLTHAHALLHGRTSLSPDDLLFAERIAVSSSPGAKCSVLLALDSGAVEAPQIASKLSIPGTSVLACLEDLQRSGIVEACGSLDRDGRGRPATIWKLLEA
jgi:hypothetical protein